MKKTNVMRILDSLKIPYTPREYDDDKEHTLAHGVAAQTAKKLGVNPECIFKTIIMCTEKKEVVVFCQNSLSEINLKKARNACGAKEITPVKQEELLFLTGYVRGGCSPLGMKKKFRTFFDESILKCEKVCISAGTRGLQLELAGADLIKATAGIVVDLHLE